MKKEKKAKDFNPWSDSNSEQTKLNKEHEKQIVAKVFYKTDSSATTTNLKPKDHFEQLQTDGVIYEPLYTPQVWSYFLEKNTRYRRSAEIMSRNTVGLGVEIVPLKQTELTEEIPDDLIKRETMEAMELIENINDKLSLEELNFHVKLDEESTGQSYYELLRSLDGSRVVKLNQIESFTVRRAMTTMGRARWVHMHPSGRGDKIFYKEYGEEANLNYKTGLWEEEYLQETGEVLPEELYANELYQFRLYTPRSSFYGVPRIVSADNAIAGQSFAHQRNVAFFENDATPRFIITVSNGRLSAESTEMIEDFAVSNGKGPGNNGRALLLQAEDGMFQKDSSLKIEVTPLTVGITEDASFLKYMEACNEEIREAFGISKIFFGTTNDYNRATAMAAKTMTIEQVFEPETKRYERALNKILIKGNGFKSIRLQLKRSRAVDAIEELVALADTSRAGGVSPNDIAEARGKKRYTGKWADTPLEVLKLGFIEDENDELARVSTLYGETEQDNTFADPEDAAKLFPEELQEDFIGYANNLIEMLKTIPNAEVIFKKPKVLS